ncbi:hypothetical protein QQS21_009798 [Conoideocrella luteorostrata]|uniref:Uncharacterized protein n=1 Tax=Conoideocrella luteorostrata TaxID=1105319 RepID=A0AAJ0CIJ9_9HYPO|nr:hypothetical protein QQS21_009798 [Conoideocrella luteorostrata]
MTSYFSTPVSSPTDEDQPYTIIIICGSQTDKLATINGLVTQFIKDNGLPYYQGDVSGGTSTWYYGGVDQRRAVFRQLRDFVAANGFKHTESADEGHLFHPSNQISVSLPQRIGQGPRR